MRDLDRVILHCDCNSFFASVETALDPSYRDVPMAVCGNEEQRHGIVLAKNELAKAYGIKTAETVYQARKKCPNLVIVKPHYNAYSEYSRRVNEIYNEYTDLVEPFGIDESWLDITASIRFFGSKEKIAEQIRRRVREEIGITVSIGVSFNKPFAKLGSDYKKPDAITYISKENFKEIVYPLPVIDLLFVGQKTSEELNRLGIRTIGDLAEFDANFLVSRIGKMGETLHSYAAGLDNTPVCKSTGDAKSISNGLTFSHDITKREECIVGLDYLCEELGLKLRSKSLLCTSISLTVKDEYLRTLQRQKAMPKPSDIGSELSCAAYELLCENWPENKPIRMLTVSAIGLIKQDSYREQLGFFNKSADNNRAKEKKKEETIDIIRQKYGGKAILRGTVINSDIGIYNEEDKS